jgi:hypothetical protein
VPRAYYNNLIEYHYFLLAGWAGQKVDWRARRAQEG